MNGHKSLLGDSNNGFPDSGPSVVQGFITPTPVLQSLNPAFILFSYLRGSLRGYFNTYGYPLSLPKILNSPSHGKIGPILIEGKST